MVSISKIKERGRGQRIISQYLQLRGRLPTLPMAADDELLHNSIHALHEGSMHQPQTAAQLP